MTVNSLIKTGAILMSAAFTPLATAAEDTSADEAALETIIESVGNLADTQNFESLEKIYADEILVDYSSLNGQPAEVKSPQGLMTEWAGVLPGFDRTRHRISNIRVTLNGSTALASADVSASHWVGNLYWRVEGTYDYAFLETDEGWQITAMTLNVEDEVGTRDAFGPAIEAAAANPVSYLQRAQTRETVRTFLTSLEEKDMETFNALWAEEAVQEMPYVPAGWPNRIVGRDALIAQYAGWPDVAASASFTDDLIFYPMQDPQMIYVEFRGQTEVATTGRLYDQTYGALFQVQSGKIVLYKEYFDPRRFSEAFGLEED